MKNVDEHYIYFINKHYNELRSELASIDNDFENFQKNLVVQKAIKMDLFQIGEQFGNLSTCLINQLNPRDYRGIRDIRNYIAHGYIEIKDSIIWNTIINELPVLIEALNQSYEILIKSNNITKQN